MSARPDADATGTTIVAYNAHSLAMRLCPGRAAVVLLAARVATGVAISTSNAGEREARRVLEAAAG